MVDTAARRLVARVPYLAAVGPPSFGEYRAGVRGLALSPDGARLYVGVNLPGGNGRLEVLDTALLRMVGGATVGVRPFDVVASRDGRFIYSIDHDSFGVTIVEAATLTTRTVAITPAGRDAFAKPHYGAIGPDDRLLLPIMGRYLVGLGADGTTTLAPLTANTHQHGTAMTADGRRLLIVGTGPAGGATGRASLTILELASGAETILPLARTRARRHHPGRPHRLPERRLYPHRRRLGRDHGARPGDRGGAGGRGAGFAAGRGGVAVGPSPPDKRRGVSS